MKKGLNLSSLPLSCNISAEFGSNSNALVKSAIAWYNQIIEYVRDSASVDSARESIKIKTKLQTGIHKLQSQKALTTSSVLFKALQILPLPTSKFADQD